MILFAADNHYGQHCGRNQYECLADDYEIYFQEDNWDCFTQIDLGKDVELLMLNMIADTCNVSAPPDEASANVKAYVDAGKPLLLLHGASAAFWHWEWWRPIVGHRWVRGNDPDGVESSTHPVRPFRLDVCKVRHPLAEQLRAIDVPSDEIYTNLEQTCPTMSLMNTTTDEGTFVQAYVCETPAGGTIASYIPGHKPEVVRHPDMIHNVRVLLDFLLDS